VAPDRKTLYCKRHYNEIHVQGRRTDEEIAAGTKGPSFVPVKTAAKAAVTIGVQQTKCKKCSKSVYSEEMVHHLQHIKVFQLSEIDDAPLP
jgi:hypothetical protein